MKIFPNKLSEGDEVRIIAPSLSLKIVSQDNIAYAIKILKSLGLQITFGLNTNESDIFLSSSIESRINDLHEAFSDKKVKAILTAIGGFNSNELLSYLDYDLIKDNPKIFCGYSDITALQNAIFHKTGLITYSGPHFSSFAMEKGAEYNIEYFKNIFFEKKTFELKSSKEWSDDSWFIDQEKRIFFENKGYIALNQGEAMGTIIGGNLSTLHLLHGTEYMPSLKDKILFIEADSFTENDLNEFNRTLQSLIHQPYFHMVKAIVFGRFENKFGMDLEKLKFIINTKKELKRIPIVAEADFGHTMPMFTFPIGGQCKIIVNGSSIKIELVEF